MPLALDIKARIAAAFCLPALLLPLRTIAAPQRLAGLSATAYRQSGSETVIATSGTAKLKITFRLAQMVRVQVAPTGVFAENPSFATVPQPWPAVPVRVTDAGGVLTLRSADMIVHVAKHGLRVSVYGDGGATLLTGDAPDGGTRWDAATGAVGQALPLAPGERIYGLGQDNGNGGTLDRRGTVCDLWTGQQIRSGDVTADDPVPFYLSTGRHGHGYGVFVDNVWRLRVDVGKTRPDRLDWSAPGGPIDYYVIDGPSFKSILGRYTRLTGHPALLPLWAYGYWQSRCVYSNFPEMQNVAATLRGDGIPVDVMVIDYSWPAHFQDFHWSDGWLASGKKPADYLAQMRADGLHVVQSNSGPMIRQDSPNYQSGWDAGIFATDGHGDPVTCGYYGGELMDFTSPNMPGWLYPQLTPLHDQGIAGWWLDLIEPEGEPSNVVYHAGRSADIHNEFSSRVIRTYYGFQKSVAPTSRPVMLARAGTAGVQRFGPILWTGDTHSDWPTFRAQIPEAQNSGLSGLAWWTNDSGGFLSGFYKDDQYGAHAQLYARWLEFSSFAPVARAHKAGPSEPFRYGPVAISAARKYLGLRYRLMPYLYSNAYATHETGLPLLRPLVLEYQDDPLAAETKDEFLFGRDILVAPVTQEDATARAVYLPHGQWIGLEDGLSYTGGMTMNVQAPYDHLPLFVRAGAILPMAPPMLSTGEKPWDPLTLAVYPHGDSRFTLYADDGRTTAFEHGAFTTTALHCHEAPGRLVTLSIAESNRLFTPKTWVVHFHLTSGFRSVTVDNHPAASQYDPPADMLTVRLANGTAKTHLIQVTLDGTARPRPTPPAVTLTAADRGMTP